MRKFITAILTAFTLTAHADNRGTVTASNTEGFVSSENLIYNANFEAGTSVTGSGWTESGGTFSIWGVTPLRGAREGLWDASAASQTLSSKLSAISPGMYGQNAVASCLIRTASGTATHTLSVSDGTNKIASGSIVSSPTAVYTRVQFIMPTSGSVRLVLTSVAANEPSIEIDDCYIGLNTGVAQVSQATLVGTLITTNASTQWTSTSATYADYATVVTGLTYTATGSVEAPSVSQPGFRLRNAPPGNYMVIINNLLMSTGTTTGCNYRFTDGTYTSTEEAAKYDPGSVGATFHISVTAPITDTTFKLQTKRYTGGNACSSVASAASPAYFTVYRFPLSSETVVRADVLTQSWSGYHDGTCTWTTTSGTFVDPADDATCNFATRQSRNFPGVVSSGNKGPGIVFTPTITGRYWVCAKAQFNNTNSTSYSYIRLVDGSLNVLNQGTNYGGDLAQTTLCGVLNVPALASTTVKLQLYAGSNTARIDGVGAFSGASAIEWTVFPIDQGVQNPVYVGSVSSGSSGQMSVESAVIGGASETTSCAASPCGVFRSSSPGWISVTRTAQGNYVATFATGLFSQAPVCNATNSLVAATGRILTYQGNSSTNADIEAWNNSDAANDVGFNIICMGPKP